MSQSQAQKSFVSFFVLLLVCDFAAQLALVMQLVELQPLVSIWLGPLDDVFYGLCGVQAVYFLLDPLGESREGAQMSTTGIVKKCVALFNASTENQRRLTDGVFSGGARALSFLAGGLAMATAATFLSPVEALTTLRMVLQAHLGYLIPVGGVLVLALGFRLGRGPHSAWKKTYLAASGVLLLSAALEGRLSNHLFHLFAALSNLQAWGAAASWIGVGAALGQQPPDRVLNQRSSVEG